MRTGSGSGAQNRCNYSLIAPAIRNATTVATHSKPNWAYGSHGTITTTQPLLALDAERWSPCGSNFLMAPSREFPGNLTAYNESYVGKRSSSVVHATTYAPAF